MSAFALYPSCITTRGATRTTPTCCESNGRTISRRHALALFCSAAAAAVSRPPPNANADEEPPTPQSGYLTKSGLKYVDFNVGTGERPSWGDYVTIHYVAYTISPDGKTLQKEHTTYGKTDGFLIHHGNGEMILGLEEAIHSMQVGGKRRAIIPPLLAYNDIDLGPVPPESWVRRRFSKHLQEGDGSVVFDIELLAVKPNPLDRGYYQDLQLTEEEEISAARQSAAEYAEECRKAGIDPPDPDTPYAPYMLGDEREFPYSPYVSPGLPRPDQPKEDFSIVF